MQPDDTITICCFKWGNTYSPEYVNILFDNVRTNLSHPFEFYCFTNDAQGLDERIKIIDLEFLSTPPGDRFGQAWPKLYVYGKYLPTNRITIMMDLDVIILGTLDPLIDVVKQKGGLHIVRQLMDPLGETLLPRKWRRDRGGNSSLVGFIPQEQHHIYDRFCEIREANKNKEDYKYLSDQRFASTHAHNRHFWNESAVKIFKRQCVPITFFGKPKPTPKPDERCRIIVFPGDPNPSDLCNPNIGAWGRGRRRGHGPVQWVKDAWQRRD